MMRQYSLLVALFFTSNIFSQLDLNKCSIEIKESFNPRVLMFSDNYLLTHAYNENTLYLVGNNKTKVFPTQGYGVITAFIDNEEKYLAISNYHKTIDIHNIDESLHIKKIDIDALAYTIQLNDDKLYCGLSNGEILVDSIFSSNKLRIKAHTDVIRDIALVKNLLLTVSHDGFLKVWDINNNLKNLESISLGKVLTQVEVSPNKTQIAVGCFDGTVYILNDKYKITRKIHPNNSIITQIKFKDELTIVSSSFDKRIVSTDLEQKNYSELYKADDYITNFDMTNDKFIYSSRSGKILYYNLKCSPIK